MLCQRDLVANGVGDVSVFEEAVWSGEETLSLRRDLRDGRGWSAAVGPLENDSAEPAVRGMGIGALLQRMVALPHGELLVAVGRPTPEEMLAALQEAAEENWGAGH